MLTCDLNTRHLHRCQRTRSCLTILYPVALVSALRCVKHRVCLYYCFSNICWSSVVAAALFCCDLDDGVTCFCGRKTQVFTLWFRKVEFTWLCDVKNKCFVDLGGYEDEKWPQILIQKPVVHDGLLPVPWIWPCVSVAGKDLKLYLMYNTIHKRNMTTGTKRKIKIFCLIAKVIFVLSRIGVFHFSPIPFYIFFIICLFP